MNLKPFLEDLERRIDPAVEDRMHADWLAFADGKCTTPIFAPAREKNLPGIEWPTAYINDALEDLDFMVYSQLKGASDVLASGNGGVMCARGNYGTGIIPSMVGAAPFIMPYEQNILPGSCPLSGGEDELRAVVAAGTYDFSKGFAGKVFAFGEKWSETIKDYPNIQKYVNLYNPDMQGPLPLLESIWGSDVYYAFYDDPDFIYDAMKFFTDIYIDFTQKWQGLYPTFDADHSVEWGLLHKGRTILRNDAAMNLSREMYEEFIAEHDARVFKTLGGGMHFCGKGDHYLPVMTAMEGLYCVNMSQPEYNDMEAIYQTTVDRGITIIGMPSEEALRATQVRPLRGLVHSGVSKAAFEEIKIK